jgi:hypothetical protein
VENEAALEHTIVAVVMPDGKAVFTVTDHKDVALSKAKSVMRRAAKGATTSPKEFRVTAPAVITFQTSEELFVAIGEQSERIQDAWILAKGQKCGKLIVGSDSGCHGTTNFASRTIYYDHHVCERGSKQDECWNNPNGAVGLYRTYSSLQACKNGATPLTTDTLRDTCCDCN